MHLLGELARLDAPPEPQWWVRESLAMARELETDAAYQPRHGAFHARYSGAFLLETVPSVLYILMKHAQDRPRQPLDGVQGAVGIAPVSVGPVD